MYCVVVSSGSVTLLERVSDVSQCPMSAGAFVALEPGDVPPSPFLMSVDQALVVSGAIATLWCTA